MKRKIILSVLLSSILFADSMSDALDGFDDTPVVEALADSNNSMADFNETNISNETETTESLIEGLTGKITEQVAYSYNGDKPHDKFSSLKSSILLDYEHKFENGWRIKTNGKWYYDAVYDLRNHSYSNNELKEQRHETELFDAYIEGSITDTIDMKLGRQVVVWGRSDTIRITDVLNPIDNRRPGMVDIEDLRLPTAMAKFDFFYKDWRVTPIAILEQRFSKNPAFGSAFNPMKNPYIPKQDYKDVTYALSVGGEFSGWDVNFYAARVHDDAGYVKFAPKPTFTHDKVNMFGSALNVLSGAWLFKTELAYFDKLKYTSTGDKEFSRTDALVGLEYKGFADTMISYDVSLRHFNQYDNRLKQERILKDRDTYQHAFRISSDFMNATLTANYLISLYGKKLDEGGFQRAWVKYELAEGVNTNFGVVDYIGGSTLFDSIKKNDMVFVDISYSF
ncbi:MAG: DUF1302 domain-containing protein [Sulfurovum sp.]|nr:DUF1302 domain-containing protein [Sulfurovum sp.]